MDNGTNELIEFINLDDPIKIGDGVTVFATMSRKEVMKILFVLHEWERSVGGSTDCTRLIEKLRTIIAEG